MNQFRRAKQKALDSGHQVENITDIQTAGVKEPAKEEKNTKEEKVKPVPTPIKIENPVISESTSVKQETTVTAKPAPVITEITTTTEPAPVITEATVTTEPAPAMTEVTATTESAPVITEAAVTTEPAPVLTNTSLKTEAIPVKVEAPIIVNPTPIKSEAPTIVEQVQTQVDMPVSIIPETAYEETIQEQNLQVQQPQVTPIPVPVRIAPAPSVREVTYTATPAVTTVQATTKPSTGKKNIPNIFAPKNEAKSMRKSLVLKPTSVKIAENYCAKNGVSFNELIQTLLDNFIDEYGL